MATRKQSPVASRKTSTPPADLFVSTTTAEEEEPEVVVEPARKVKKTFHLDPEVVKIMMRLQYEDVDSDNPKPNLSELVEEGIRLLDRSRQESKQAAASTS